jgi:hypothetical protein
MPHSSYNYYHNARKEYYERRLFPQTFFAFKDLITNNFSVLNSSTLIKLGKVEFGEIYQSVVKLLGKPRYAIKNNDFSPTVYFYKNKILNHELIRVC